jgi:(p)ppGpp synthase/HD superfamily hydrolase
MINKAKEFAIEKHGNQVRKFTEEPYVLHPIAVANIVRKFKESKHIDELVVSALLHDVVEDCNVDIKEIGELFGDFVASIVLELTNDGKMIKKYGKKVYLSYKMLNMSSYALVVKLSDRLHNVRELRKTSVKFREKYSEETKYIISVLRDFRELTGPQIQLIKEIEECLI